MRNPRWHARLVLAGLLLVPFSAAGESRPPACEALQARAASCEMVVPSSLAYDGGSQGCGDGGSGCHLSY
jgi:hypothetical protein